MRPLSLYIHIPWCVRKCPYCDFNSHVARKNIPESDYVNALLQDLQQDISRFETRPIQTIFLGGGTPSLFSPESIAKLLMEISKQLPFASNIEITLEANPGTFEQDKFKGFRHAGVNRLSLGCQSFQNDKLQKLGRIHGASDAILAITAAKEAQFNSFNIDLMFGLPNQSLDDALFDLQTAIDLKPQHLSWYQLTLEPETFFAKHPPRLPEDETIWAIQKTGQALLQERGFQPYEISAYAKPGFQCRHNRQYWEFGDYLGIGAGAHGKMTQDGKISRTVKYKNPKKYLESTPYFCESISEVLPEQLPFEFMLNALRLSEPIHKELFEQQTFLDSRTLAPTITKAVEKNLLAPDENYFRKTELGERFLNDLMEMFLHSDNF